MKSVSFLSLFILLQLVLLVASQSLIEIIYELIQNNDQERNAASIKISTQFDECKGNLNKQLIENVIPSLKGVFQDVENYIKNLENQTLSRGYDPTDCITQYREAVTLAAIPNITGKAVYEWANIYERIVENIRFMGLHNIKVISNEIDTIASEFLLCVSSQAPAFCNGTLVDKIMKKQDALPILYEKEVEKTTLEFTQKVIDYENRGQDYLQEATLAMKPFIELLESCGSVMLVVS